MSIGTVWRSWAGPRDRKQRGLEPITGMRGRYEIEKHWQQYRQAAYFNWQDPPWPTLDPLKGSDARGRPTDVDHPSQRAESALPELRR